ncbi:MAG TPA: hypothetical protein VE776_09275 [Actinomycetota bacterium]|jgi:hypothetical protein|nr:hypothetical protein [Actinomycetota bacterium]
MRYATAVRRLRTIAEECDRHAKFWDDPLVVAAYVYGSLLEGPEEVERVQVALVVDMPPDQVTWWAEPPSAAAFAEIIGLGKAPVQWWWRPVLWPVWNHEISGPVRFWSLDGPDEGALEAIAQHRLGELHRLVPTAEEELEQLEEELLASLTHLRKVTESYWDIEWRRDHRGLGVYPEHHLWRASKGYLDLLAAVEPRRATSGPA